MLLQNGDVWRRKAAEVAARLLARLLLGQKSPGVTLPQALAHRAARLLTEQRARELEEPPNAERPRHEHRADAGRARRARRTGLRRRCPQAIMISTARPSSFKAGGERVSEHARRLGRLDGSRSVAATPTERTRRDARVGAELERE